MKIIFNSEKEKELFINGVCPGHIGLTETCKAGGYCEECFRLAGVEMEVKEVDHG